MTYEVQDNLPRILCLHGGGTSATIFKIQTRRLIFVLRNHFKFVFVSAPFDSVPGPGVEPVFTDCGPFHRWLAPEGQPEYPAQLKVRELLKQTIRDDGGDFVGVLGFSQGARMTAGLLADQAEGNNAGMPNFDFGVLLCGGQPPMSLNAAKTPYKAARSDEHGPIFEHRDFELIDSPTVHVRGTQDPHFEKGKRLAGFFSDKIELEYNMGHHQPGAAGDTTSPKNATMEIAEAILTQYGVKNFADLNRLDGNDRTPQPEMAKSRAVQV